MNYFKKGIITMIAALGASALFSISAFAADTGYVTTEVLNVRSAATTNSSVVTQVSMGSAVSIIGYTPGWYEINYNGKSAFVSEDYVRVGGADVSRNGGDRSKGQRVVDIARQYIGTPYRYGGMSPAGFDCSGLVKYCYSQMGINLNRTAASQTGNGYAVSKSELVPGDIVFFVTGGGGISHSGIYVGDGMMIHSPKPGRSVEMVTINSGYYANTYSCARRIF
ncbi:MAG: NlpC/P60 family protein [Ruminococcaceae bacterium]|nr:NlpC/P60 family protein [Oscillospiraceae bacterium]